MKSFVMALTVAAVALLAAACGGERSGERSDSRAAPVPAWSPDSSDLLFTSNRDGNADIFLKPRGGGEWINLTRHPDGDNWPVWSPDGTRIAFQRRKEQNLDVWVMGADGSNPVQLTDHPEPDYLPSWTPDGARITFTSWRQTPEDTARAPYIWIMNADGSDQRRLVASTLGTSAGAEWHPDGDRFVTTRKFDPDAFDVTRYAADGGGEQRLTHGPGYCGSAVFSPDGTRVAFYHDEGDSSSLVVIDADGSNRRTVHHGGKYWYPRWSPDGAWLAYTAAAGPEEDDLDLLAIRADGSGDPVPLVVGPERALEGSWRPAAPRE